MAFYYYEPSEKVYRQVSDDKLGNLMRAFIVRCAEELGNDVGKWKLFTEFRSDKTIRSITHRAKSILAADDTFFSVESGNRRQRGPELYERVARSFVEQALTREPGQTLFVTDAYVHFCQYLRSKNMAPVNRQVFKALVPAAIQEEFKLGICHNLRDEAGDGCKRGWRGIRPRDAELTAEQN